MEGLKVWTEFSWLQLSPAAASCEHDNESSGSQWKAENLLIGCNLSRTLLHRVINLGKKTMWCPGCNLNKETLCFGRRGYIHVLQITKSLPRCSFHSSRCSEQSSQELHCTCLFLWTYSDVSVVVLFFHLLNADCLFLWQLLSFSLYCS